MISRRTLLAGIPAVLTAARTVAPPAPYGAVPSPRQLAWHDLEFTAFLHFTVNTFTNKEWGYGDEDPNIFNPEKFDADAIVGALADAGVRGVILTCKHHDGFCLWPTKTTDHSVFQSSWRGGKGDVVRDISQAAARRKMKFGVYLSPWDRNNAEYGTPEYIKIYRAQLSELLTGYGPIFEVWHDGANGGDGFYGGAREKRTIDKNTYYDWPRTWEMIRAMQPEAVVFSDVGPDVRWVGNERGIAGRPVLGHFRSRGRRRRTGVARQRAHQGIHQRPASRIEMAARRMRRVDSSGLVLARGGKCAGQEAGATHQPLLSIGGPRRHAAAQRAAQSRRPALSRGRRVAARVSAHTCAKRSARTWRRAPRPMPPTCAATTSNSVPPTCWTAAPIPIGRRTTRVTSADVTIDLGHPVKFQVIRLKEAIRFGQRVDAFTVERWQSDSWVPVASSTSIGPRRLIRLDAPIIATRLRLRITQASASPALSEFAVFSESAPG